MSERAEILKQLKLHSPLWMKILKREYVALESENRRLREALELIVADNDCMVGAGITEEMIGEDECYHCIAEKALHQKGEK